VGGVPRPGQPRWATVRTTLDRGSSGVRTSGARIGLQLALWNHAANRGVFRGAIS
jgi:hypothetical protein